MGKSHKSSLCFAAIQGSVLDAAQKIDQLGALIQEFSKESQQIVKAMEEVSSISQEGAAGIQETSASSEEQLAATARYARLYE